MLRTNTWKYILYSDQAAFIFVKKVLTSYPYYKHYRTAVAVCLSFLFIIGILLLVYGKKDSFILINGYYTPELDYFFQYVTYVGDGLIYIPLVVYSVFWNRKFLIPVLTGIVLCTLLSQGLKRFVFEDELRPISLELEMWSFIRSKACPCEAGTAFHPDIPARHLRCPSFCAAL